MSNLDSSAISELKRGKGEINRVFRALYRYTFSQKGNHGFREAHHFQDKDSINAEEIDAEIEDHTGRTLRTKQFFVGENFKNTTGEPRKDLWISQNKLMELTDINKRNLRSILNTDLDNLGVPIQRRKEHRAYYRLDDEELINFFFEEYENKIKSLEDYEKQLFKELLVDDVERTYQDDYPKAPKLLSEQRDEFILYQEVMNDLREIFRDYLEWEAKTDVYDTVADKLLERINRISGVKAERYKSEDVKNLHQDKLEFLKTTFAALDFSRQIEGERNRWLYLNYLKNIVGFSKFIHPPNIPENNPKVDEILDAFQKTSKDIKTKRSPASKARFLISKIFRR